MFLLYFCVLTGEAWKNQEENDNPIGMFGPGTRVMDRHLSFNDYQVGTRSAVFVCLRVIEAPYM